MRENTNQKLLRIWTLFTQCKCRRLILELEIEESELPFVDLFSVSTKHDQQETLIVLFLVFEVIWVTLEKKTKNLARGVSIVFSSKVFNRWWEAITAIT